MEEVEKYMFTWDDKYSVSIKEMDDHHKKLVALINDLHNAMKAGKSKEVMAEILNKLIDYTGFHFAAEEKYFKLYNYPDAEAHKAQHQQFVAKVSNFKTDFTVGKVMLSMEVMDFLKNWLIQHISQTDKKYGPFLKEKGVK